MQAYLKMIAMRRCGCKKEGPVLPTQSKLTPSSQLQLHGDDGAVGDDYHDHHHYIMVMVRADSDYNHHHHGGDGDDDKSKI